MKLLRKGDFRWCTEAEGTFLMLKCAETSSPVLQLPDFNNKLVVECDASGSGFRTVLHQGMGLVAFFSKLITAWHTKLDQRLSTANVASSTPSTRR
jgi:hypothetical protein